MNLHFLNFFCKGFQFLKETHLKITKINLLADLKFHINSILSHLKSYHFLKVLTHILNLSI